MVTSVTFRAAVVLIPGLWGVPASLWAGEGKGWGYDGDVGPEHWGELADEFDMCSRGLNQSPVDLVADLDADLPELRFEYTNPGQLRDINNGHALQVDANPGNYLHIQDDRYQLLQFHLHSPSEHRVSGREYPMEIHLVHQDDKGALAVVGILFAEGAHNELVDRLPSFQAAGDGAADADPIDYNELISNRKDYFYYNGSLTTPPCSEGVTWIVLKKPIVASAAQIQRFHDLLGFDNNRPVQPPNSRLILD